jgi:hypothetical protein
VCQCQKARQEIRSTLRRTWGTRRFPLTLQDLIKSFLRATLPMDCQDVLSDFMREIDLPGRNGSTAGFLVFRGGRRSWEVTTGWSHLMR